MCVGGDVDTRTKEHKERMAALKESFVNSKKTKYPWEL
jgi:hypothetical protein